MIVGSSESESSEHSDFLLLNDILLLLLFETNELLREELSR